MKISLDIEQQNENNLPDPRLNKGFSLKHCDNKNKDMAISWNKQHFLGEGTDVEKF